MTKFYRKSDYGRNPLAEFANVRNSSNGWSGVWPGGVAQKNLGQVKFRVPAGHLVSFPIRKELVPIVEVLFALGVVLGYPPKAGQTWGYANRPIRGTSTPSNHSRARAVDMNSLNNPMQSVFKSDIPPVVVAAWESCDFYWGGRYERRPDAMHFEYVRSPGHVAQSLAHARGLLKHAGPTKPPPAQTRRPGSRPIGVGDRGDDVAYLQRWLALEDDGVFGARTEARVRWYQEKVGLPATGSVNAATWAKLLA